MTRARLRGLPHSRQPAQAGFVTIAEGFSPPASRCVSIERSMGRKEEFYVLLGLLVTYEEVARCPG